MWAPSYTLRLDKASKTFTLQGNASLLCDLPFFKGNIVESVALMSVQPKLECQKINDPLASGVSGANFMRQIGTAAFDSAITSNRRRPMGSPSYRMSDTSVRRKSMEKAKSYPCTTFLEEYITSGDSDDEYEPAQGIREKEIVDDVYFYQLKNVPLHYNRPLSLPFIDERPPQPYKDVYYFDLDNKSNAGRTGIDDTRVEATHAIMFKNTTGQPFTAGPVSVLTAEDTQSGGEINTEGSQPKQINKLNTFMLQGLMKFTALNKMATIDILEAADVEGKFEIVSSKDKQAEAAENGCELARTHKTGKFTIINMKNEEVTCKVDHLLYGNLETSEPMHIEVTECQRTGLQEINPTSKYVWEITVPAKGKSDLVFKYYIKKWKLTKVKREANQSD